MSIWLCRAGKNGEYENKFLAEGKIYLTWDDLDIELKSITDWDPMLKVLNTKYPNEKPKTIINWASQIMPFVHDFQIGDWVILPSKIKPVIYVGEIKSLYQFSIKNGSPYYHYHDVEWFGKDIPRSAFDQDILYSLGAFLTICKISRNDAEERIKEMYKNGWSVKNTSINQRSEIIGNEVIDVEQVSRDDIAKFIYAKYKGHGLTTLIDAVLRAQGYTTYKSPEGPDKGVDILAAPGGLGFGHPRICVQVKSQQTPVERTVLDQLIGVMQNIQAEQGLLVSWGGFKQSIEKEIAAQFFRVRLWSQNEILEELLQNYDKLDDEIKAEIPLKKIWVLAGSDK